MDSGESLAMDKKLSALLKKIIMNQPLKKQRFS